MVIEPVRLYMLWAYSQIEKRIVLFLLVGKRPWFVEGWGGNRTHDVDFPDCKENTII